jgi:DNA-binding CsgD family transcriptional regulator
MTDDRRSPPGPDEGTLRRLIQLVDPTGHTGAGEHVPWSLLKALAAVIGCDFVTFQVMNPAHQQVSNQILAPAHSSDEARVTAESDDDDIDLFWRGLGDCAACSYPLRSGDHHTVTRLSDFYTQSEFRRTAMGAYAARAGFSREIMLPLPPDGENDRRLLLFREAGPDFTDRDTLLLTLLRPHIYSLHLRQRYRNRGLPPLTARQMEILRMVATGLSNTQIARALCVSEATIGKHLENIYSRLAVSNRAAAAITWTRVDDLALAAPKPSAHRNHGRS